MSVVGQRPETVSKKKRDFFLMGECFFLTYFPIGACPLFSLNSGREFTCQGFIA